MSMIWIWQPVKPVNSAAAFGHFRYQLIWHFPGAPVVHLLR